MRASKTELPIIVKGDGFVFRGAIWGGIRAEVASFDKDFDEAPFLKGLPDNLSRAPASGYVISQEEAKNAFRGATTYFPWVTSDMRV
ncbi:MAG: hypothetical protein ACXV5F_07945 [Halobacteriota archaeon]